MSSLTSYLAKKGAVNPARLQKALLNQAINGGSTGLSLLEVEAISEEQLVEMTGKFFHLSTIELSGCLSADPDVVRSLPRTRCQDLGLVAVGRDDDRLMVACVEPPTGTALDLLEKDAPARITFVIASPVAVALVLALHHDVQLDPRIATLVRRDGPLELDGVPGDVPEVLEALLEGASGAAAPEQEEEDDWDDDWDEDEDEEDEEEEEAPEEGRSSIVGKYIIVNRIGARKRRPSIQHVRPAQLEEPDGAEESEERPAEEPEEKPADAEVTFTDGSLRATRNTRPKRPSSVPPPPRDPEPMPPRARTGPDSVPAAILKEVVEEYLEDGFRPPRRQPTPRPEPREPARKPDEVTVTRTVKVTPQPAEPVKVEKAEEPEPPRRKPVTQTLHGMKVLDDLKAAPEGAVQGYSVEVPEILSLSDALAEIETSESAGEITDVVHRYALQFFDFVIMMRYRRGRFELAGASTRGWAWPLDKLPKQVMGYDQLPESVRKVGQPHLGPVDGDGTIAEIIEKVGRPIPANGMLMPISLKGRAIVMIYGDNGERATSFDEVHDLFHATWVATNTLLSLLEERKK
jgi:hypothetical protein